ncbi:MAG: NAD(+)/NADH kinase [Elusimicrobia bacterium]|nr:NAD(+)/NADH kinase [Elusimicrobiota bacterium]
MIVVFYNSRKPMAARMLAAIKKLAHRRGRRIIGVDVVSTRQGHGPRPIFFKNKPALGVSLGGDGTLLTAARFLAPEKVPLMGINLGGLGFLSTTEEAHWRRAMEQALQGKLIEERRLAFEVEVFQGRRRQFQLAVNDCVVRCGANPRMIEIKVSSDRHGYLAHLRGDGLIVATPSGSTAYALGAGGPIVEPSVPAYLVLPLASHSLTQRPIVLEASQSLTVTLGAYHDEPARALVVLDGQTSFQINEGDTVKLRPSEHPVILLTSPQHSYFRSLREKLHWSH